jgi:uncharacterized protein
MNTHASQEKFPLDYFLLVFVFAIPFWVFGGRSKLPLINLPSGALVTFVPVSAAAVVSYRRSGLSGISMLFRKALDYRKIIHKGQYVPAVLLPSGIYILSYLILRLSQQPLPEHIEISVQMAPVFTVIYFIGATGEELGWTGYALGPMENRWGTLKSGLILGVIWAIWHIIPFMQTGNTGSWIVWQSLKTVAMRILIVWVYKNTGRSTFAAILYHTAENVSWALFPNYSSHYTPSVTNLVNWMVVAIIAQRWRAKTFSQFPETGSSS